MKLLTLACILFATSASAQCGDHDEMVKRLANKFDEHPVAVGIDSKGLLVEVFASESGSYTVLMTAPPPNKVSCIPSHGEGWIFLEAGKPGEKS